MSPYTKVNFMDIEAGEGPSQGRFARKTLETKDVGVTYWKYEPNYRAQKGHKHAVQEEVYVVIAGSGRVLLNDIVEDLKQWDALRVAPETTRAFEAGAEGLEMIIVGGPKPEGGDGERAEITWPN